MMKHSRGEVERKKEKQSCFVFLKIIFLMSWRKKWGSVGAAEMSKKQPHKRNTALEQAVTSHHCLPTSEWPGSDPHHPLEALGQERMILKNESSKR